VRRELKPHKWDPKKIGRKERNFITDRLFQLFLKANPVSTAICNFMAREILLQFVQG